MVYGGPHFGLAAFINVVRHQKPYHGVMRYTVCVCLVRAQEMYRFRALVRIQK